MYPDDLPRRERAIILSEQQGHRCCYCGVHFSDEMPTDIRHYVDPRPSVEHVVRIADGGKRNWHNEVAACRGCNSARGEIPPNEWFTIVSTGDLESIRRALRSRGRKNPMRRGAFSVFNRRAGRWPPTLGEVALTPERREYFALVYGVYL